LAKACAARSFSSSSRACSGDSLDDFAPANALLRLDSPLCRCQVLRRLPRLGLLLWPLAGGWRSGSIDGGINRFCFRCHRSNLGQGF
jgi:hypothetical protein